MPDDVRADCAVVFVLLRGFPRPETVMRRTEFLSTEELSTAGHERPAIVQIVGPTDNWILEKLARVLVAKLPYASFSPWEPTRNGPPGLAYYVNYGLFQGPTSLIDVGFFTHRDDSQGFLERARAMDYCVSMARTTADWLTAQGIRNGCHISMGFDQLRYRPRLVLGVVGRTDHPRKGKTLIDAVRQMPFVEVRTTEGNFGEEELCDFYQAVDYVLIASTVEGGPMCLLEGLGFGKPVIAPEDVGIVPEIADDSSVLRFRTGDVQSLLAVVHDCLARKQQTSRLVAGRSWDQWAEDHDELFRGLLGTRGIDLPEPAPEFRFGLLEELDVPQGVNTARLEAIVDRAARHLYFGNSNDAEAVLAEGTAEFPCLATLCCPLSAV